MLSKCGVLKINKLRRSRRYNSSFIIKYNVIDLISSYKGNERFRIQQPPNIQKYNDDNFFSDVLDSKNMHHIQIDVSEKSFVPWICMFNIVKDTNKEELRSTVKKVINT